MSIIDSFDESEEIVKAELCVIGQKKLPEIAIVGFKKELMDYIAGNTKFKEYSSIDVCGEAVKIYVTNIGESEVMIYRTYTGGPASTAMMEELHARGVKKFIIFGSCGQLTSNLKKGAFIIPTEAYRDEGTSYHYLPASDFVDVESSAELAKIFEKENILYVLTKTWTTDALFKETKEKMNKRVASGCEVVEMECASIMAVAKSRGFKAYQFLYADDTLDSEVWDMKTLKEDRLYILKECLNIAYKIVEHIK